MHCARWVLSASCGTANKQDHCLIWYSVRSHYPTGILQDFLYPQHRNRKSVTMAKCAGRYCLYANQLLSMPVVLNANNQQKYKSKKQKRSFAMATLVARCCQKPISWLPDVTKKLIRSNLSRDMKSKEPIKIFISPRNRKKCCHCNTS